ncbi:MAG: cell wall-binding repeat-containing protein, partial [Lachnospiraceae bacterium]|nr:cell wall-binding repeat-containing protein [Candidatus Equihabitans merdae]
HNLTNVARVEATCTEDGRTAGKKCSRCDYTEGMAVIKALGHDYQTVPGTPATCTESGITDGRKCSRCQDEITGEVIQPKGHSWDGGKKERSLNDDYVLATTYSCRNCSETKVEVYKYDRIYGNTRIETSQKVAEAKLELNGKESFDTIVLACASNFPDALGGSYLAACVDAPMLLIDPSDPWTTLNYLDGKMTDGGKVYILGGNAAVPTGVDPVLESRGLDVTRCMGNTRIDTNLDVLNTIGVAGQSELVICSATGFADSLSASSSGRPIFIVDKAFTPEQKMWIQNHIFDRYVILGGTAAVPSSVGNEIMSLTGCAEGDIIRLAGESRYQTSKKIADYFFPHARRMLLAYGDNFPDGLSGGAYAHLLDCPVVLVNQQSTQDAADYASDKNRTYCVTLGGPGLISDQNVYTIYP